MLIIVRGKLNKWNRNLFSVKFLIKIVILLDLILDEFLFYLFNLFLAVDDIRNDIVF